MRQLFLPACVCLATWSSAIGNTDSRLSLDEFTGSLAANRKVLTRTAPVESKASAIDEPPRPAPKPAENISASRVDNEFADLSLDLAIEPPVPSGQVVNNGEPAGIPLPPIAKPVIERSEKEVCETLTQAAQRNGLPAPFFIRLLFQESRFDPGIVSSAGAQGIAQFMPETAADVGLDNPFDPLQAIPASARLLRDLFQKFGNLGLAAAAYNAGPKKIADWLADKRKKKLPEETQGYVKIITGKPVENWSDAAARHPGVKVPRHAPCQRAAGLLAWNGPAVVPTPEPAPLRVAAAAEKKQAIANSSDKAKEKVKEKPSEKSKASPKAAAQVAAHTAKHKAEHKPQRVAQW